MPEGWLTAFHMSAKNILKKSFIIISVNINCPQSIAFLCGFPSHFYDTNERYLLMVNWRYCSTCYQDNDHSSSLLTSDPNTHVICAMEYIRNILFTR